MKFYEAKILLKNLFIYLFLLCLTTRLFDNIMSLVLSKMDLSQYKLRLT
jgi:hypothetical protein